MEFIIITGLSGAGKSNAIRIMEDIGYYCVDNIPPVLIPTFYSLCEKSTDKHLKKVAIVTDIRGGDVFDALFDALNKLKSNNNNYKILYLDAKDEVILRRYKETRRKHPLADIYHGSTSDAVSFERGLLETVRNRADYIIDTSFLSPSQLKERISALFLGDSSFGLVVNCMSFGFKYGTPSEADIIFDVRCLPNPFYIPELKNFTGLDKNVYDYVMKWDQTKGFLERLISLIEYMLPLYCDEGKSQLMIAIGCTGGKHRSVATAQYLYEYLIKKGYRASVHHRDIRRT